MSWQRIRGHDQPIATLQEVVRRGRLGHAYLFAGPSGVGKKLVATEFAKALLCEAPADPLGACDRCSSCHLVDALNHPDLFFASRPDDKVEFPIDVIRESVIPQMVLKPARGGRKVTIIDDVDDFNEESANAFLKTLEEPPPQSLLILLAIDPRRLLPTISSRCQLIRFAPLPSELLSQILRDDGVEPSRAARLAQLGGGSLSQARDLNDERLWEFRGQMVAAFKDANPDTVSLAAKWYAFVDEAGKESGAKRRRAALTIRLLIDLLRSALTVSVGAGLDRTTGDDRDTVQAMAKRYGTSRLLPLIDRCLEADYHNDRRMQIELMIEALVDAFR